MGSSRIFRLRRGIVVAAMALGLAVAAPPALAATSGKPTFGPDQVLPSQRATLAAGFPPACENEPPT